MKKVLKEYYKIFLSCTVGHMMSAAQKRMEENLKLWKAMDFHEELTLDEINEFIEGSPEVPMSSQFVDKLIRPIVEGGDAVEREKALLFIERLESDGYFISE